MSSNTDEEMDHGAPESGDSTISSADRAYSLIEGRIVQVKYPPGYVLSEQQLCEELNISRTPVREALRRLAVDKLLDILPRKGAFVTNPEVKGYLHLLDLRKQVDRFATMRAAKRANEAQRAKMRRLIIELREGAALPDQAVFLSTDREYKDLIVEASRNPFVANVIAPMHAHSRRFWYFYRPQWRQNEAQTAIAHHLKVMEAVASGDVEGASIAVDELFVYLEGFAHWVLDSEYRL